MRAFVRAIDQRRGRGGGSASASCLRYTLCVLLLYDCVGDWWRCCVLYFMSPFQTACREEIISTLIMY